MTQEQLLTGPPLSLELQFEDRKEFELDRCRKNITIFIDPNADFEPTFADTTGDYGNVMVARIHLNRLSTKVRILRIFGQLPLLYVKGYQTYDESRSSMESAE